MAGDQCRRSVRSCCPPGKVLRAAYAEGGASSRLARLPMPNLLRTRLAALFAAGMAALGMLLGCEESVPAALDVAFSASDAGSPGGGNSKAPDTESPTSKRPCHMDCFGQIQCSGGTVRKSATGAFPCGSSMCPTVASYTCNSGCGSPPVDAHWSMPLQAWCKEYPKVPGDRCSGDADCSPAELPVAGPGGATPATLDCIEAEYVCGLSSAPVVADYMAKCGLGNTALKPSSYSNGVVETPACTGGACLVIDAPYAFGGLAACSRQGCTVACKTTLDCPAGSACKSAHVYKAVGSSYESTGAGSYCVPGSLLYTQKPVGACEIWW